MGSDSRHRKLQPQPLRPQNFPVVQGDATVVAVDAFARGCFSRLTASGCFSRLTAVAAMTLSTVSVLIARAAAAT